MFTGLVECQGVVAASDEMPGGLRLEIELPFASDLKTGDSVAVNGCCLTVAELSGFGANFDVGPESVRRTNLGRVKPGDRVNLERSLAAGGRIGGHFVQGHIDGVGRLIERRPEFEWDFLTFEAGELVGFVVPKGSIAVDGVSLTVVEVRNTTFSVMIVPHTAKITTLGRMPQGSEVNLEVDILGKYVFEYLQRIQAAP